MPSDIVNFELIEGLKIRIYTEGSQYDLNCLDAKEYPNLKLEETKNPLVINSGLFKTIINQTSFAIHSKVSPITLKLIPDFSTKSNGDISDTIDDAIYNGISLSLPSG